MKMDFDKLLEELTQHNQQHLLKYWSSLTEDERKCLWNDIQEINLQEVNEYFKRANESLESDGEKLDDKMKPIPPTHFESIANADPHKMKNYESKGLDAISKSQVGVLLMAGGQGTRLGFAFPKGMYNVGLPSNKSLFQIQAERILKLQQLAEERSGRRGTITWYIMTSEHTMQPTAQYLKENNYFGLDQKNIVMFEQGSLPCYDFQGKIILDAKNKISRAPDGNGGMYRALRDKNILSDMESRGIEHLHVHSVDNILIKVADPVFIGYCIEKNADCAAKVVEKSSPSEAVGVICQVDCLYQVVEYSEITQKTSELRDENGKLLFSAGNICNHYFTTKFLRRIGDQHESELKLHVAKKKIPYINDNGERVSPSTPNGIKIEKFVFDVFQFAKIFVTLEVPRDVEFSALKNADSAGKDCPSTARKDIFNLHRKYLKAAGAIVSEDVDVEIAPAVSYAGEGLEDLVKGRSFDVSPVLIDTDYVKSVGKL